jgi:alpha-tubulin suppressor-like RCC1 family protein
LMNDGTLYAFGDNANGQLGLTEGNQWSSPQKVIVPNISSSDRIVYVDCGSDHTVVLTDTGVLHGFGQNNVQQIEIDMDELCKISQVACGGSHTMVLTASGDVYTFGSNFHGQLGRDESTSTRLNFSHGSVAQIACGGLTSMILTVSGHVCAFGSNGSDFAEDQGGLGLPHGTRKYITPTKVQNLPDTLGLLGLLGLSVAQIMITKYRSRTSASSYNRGEIVCDWE